MTTELGYIADKFQTDLQALEDFAPKLNKKGQAKLAFVEAIAMLVDKDGEELPKLQFRFICEGANDSRIITYTGWLKESFTKSSKLGQILNALNLIKFPEKEAEIIEEFDLEADNFSQSKPSGEGISFADLMTKLANLEGVILLANLEKEKGIWYRPDPTTFELPVNKKSEYFRANILSFKVN